MTKPDLRIYRTAAKRLRVAPESCLYIGDGGSNELTGARQAGMHPVLIRDPVENSREVYFKREEWDGMTISSLQEILALLE
jgi:putative hydrolase of the HAD superfamily